MVYSKNMITIQQFFDKYNGKGIDWDNAFGFQCVDLYDQYCKEVIDAPIILVNGAKDIWDKYPKEHFDRVQNTPAGVPQKGDVVIWGEQLGQYGHVAIFVSGDVWSFTSFDQNFPLGSMCHYQNHDYTGVLGWLHPKKILNNEIEQLKRTILTLEQQVKSSTQDCQSLKNALNDYKTRLAKIAELAKA